MKNCTFANLHGVIFVFAAKPVIALRTVVLTENKKETFGHNFFYFSIAFVFNCILSA